MKIRIFQNSNVIRIYHSPRDVIVKPTAKKVELYDSNGILTESYDLVDRNLSWLEDKETDSAEIILDLTIKSSVNCLSDF